MLPQDAAAQTHLPLSYYTTQSALSSGHWARIKVSKEGMHQITYDQLRQLGSNGGWTTTTATLQDALTESMARAQLAQRHPRHDIRILSLGPAR